MAGDLFDDPKTKRPHYHGHRQRLRDRFRATGGEGMPDYELLELLLAQAIPRRDVKPRIASRSPLSQSTSVP